MHRAPPGPLDIGSALKLCRVVEQKIHDPPHGGTATRHSFSCGIAAEVVRRQFGNTNAVRSFFAMCHTAFSVIPSPHILPALLTRRNSLPRLTAAAASHSLSALLTQSGTGTVRTWPPLPTKSTMAPCS